MLPTRVCTVTAVEQVLLHMPKCADTVTGELAMDAHQIRHLDAVAASVGIDRAEAIHTAIAHWLDEAERTTAHRDRRLTLRARVLDDARVSQATTGRYWSPSVDRT